MGQEEKVLTVMRERVETIVIGKVGEVEKET